LSKSPITPVQYHQISVMWMLLYQQLKYLSDMRCFLFIL